MNFKVGVMRRLMSLRDKWLTSIEHSEINVVSHVPAPNSDFEHPMTSRSQALDKSELTQMEREVSAEDSPVVRTSSTCVSAEEVLTNPGSSEPGIATTSKKPTLPKFSAHVASALQHGRVAHCINAVVEECAYHVLSQGDMTSKGEYSEFSRLLCQKYTCLQFIGRNHWTHFSKELSQKIRNIRHRKKKTIKIPLCTIEGVDQIEFGNEESLMKEYTKHTPDWAKISVLFRKLHRSRRDILAEMTTQSVREILKKFPYLFNVKLVREEFELLTSCSTAEIIQRYRTMLSTVDTMIGAMSGETEEDESKEVKGLLFLQKELTDKRLKSTSKLLAIAIQQAHDVKVECLKLDPPHLLIAIHESGVHQGWVLVDDITIPCTKDQGIPGMVIELMSCYYAWDLTYPKSFMILGFIQKTLIGDEKNDFFKPAKYVEFEKKYREACL